MRELVKSDIVVRCKRRKEKKNRTKQNKTKQGNEKTRKLEAFRGGK